jgi:hypothetical protein
MERFKTKRSRILSLYSSWIEGKFPPLSHSLTTKQLNQRWQDKMRKNFGFPLTLYMYTQKVWKKKQVRNVLKEATTTNNRIILKVRLDYFIWVTKFLQPQPDYNSTGKDDDREQNCCLQFSLFDLQPHLHLWFCSTCCQLYIRIPHYSHNRK